MKINKCKCGSKVELRWYRDPEDGHYDQYNPKVEYPYIYCLGCKQRFVKVTPISSLPDPEKLAEQLYNSFPESLVFNLPVQERLKPVKKLNKQEQYLIEDWNYNTPFIQKDNNRLNK